MCQLPTVPAIGLYVDVPILQFHMISDAFSHFLQLVSIFSFLFFCSASSPCLLERSHTYYIGCCAQDFLVLGCTNGLYIVALLCGGGFDDPSCQCHEMPFRGKKEGAEKFQEICFCNCLLDGALAQAVRITLREIGSSKGHTTRCNLFEASFQQSIMARCLLAKNILC